MEVVRTALNPWGQEVIVGIAWDLVWLAVLASAAFVVVHGVWAARRSGARSARAGGAEEGGAAEKGGGAEKGAAAEGAHAGSEIPVPPRVLRHGPAARAFHWVMAVAMIALLVTGFVPGLGWEFAWVEWHWQAGLLLTAAVLFHVVHALGWQGLGEILPGRGGKYPADRKVFHHLASLAALGVIATGLLMMVRIDTPLWARNPYLLSDAAWGWVYLVHGLSGVALIGLITGHIYFALRPENRWITWAMVRGWITGKDYALHFDPDRWPPVPAAPEGVGRGAVGEGAGPE
ncbi:MAG: cytochrome b/b6 domain-containing protein [Gemmatimonadota bacterium]